MQRKKNGTLVDNLTYGYNGNLLQNVLDASTSVAPGGYPYTTGSLTDQKYVHDANGNLTKDLNNKITAVSYNFINLPKQVTKDGQMISYVYSATGEKLQAKFGNNNILNYNGTFIRVGSSLKYIITEEGRYVMNGTNGVAEYHLKDHLGNVRVVLNSAGDLIQSNSYYPFGSQLSQGGSSDNRYLFNSKEQQEISNWIDYGWRMYDGVIGRWGGIDKLSEKMYSVSCFAYGLNNPVKYKDLFGLLPKDPIVRHY
ncbi:MAG: RHS repeat domain-containing protein, partial [Butyricimonas faecihominis]